MITGCAEKTNNKNPIHNAEHNMSGNHEKDSVKSDIKTQRDTSKTKSADYLSQLPENVMKIIHTYNKIGIESLTEAIHPATGIYIIHNPGAFIVLEHFEGIKMVDDHISKQMNPLGTDFTRGSKPAFSCGEGQWDKQGVYWNADKIEMLRKVYGWMVEYELDHKKLEVSKVKEANDAIELLVYDTHSETGLYFGQINGQWYLLAIDLISPCSA